MGGHVIDLLRGAGRKHGFDVIDVTGTSFDDSLANARRRGDEYDYLVAVGGDGMPSSFPAVPLAPFDIKELRDLMEYDELELDTLGDQKTALFVILSDTDSTFNFVAALMYSQLFNLLCDKADDFYGGRLPVHVRLILDEFANIGQIPNFDKLIATIRSREISASIILQSQSQLKTIYKDAADTIVGNCDSTLFFGRQREIHPQGNFGAAGERDH